MLLGLLRCFSILSLNHIYVYVSVLSHRVICFYMFVCISCKPLAINFCCFQTQGVQPSYRTAKLSEFRASRIIQSTCSETVHRRVGSGSRLSNFIRIRRHTDTAYALRFCSICVPVPRKKKLTFLKKKQK